MRILIFILSLLIISPDLFGQQDQQFSQFLYTPTYYNPGAVGLSSQLSIIGRHRDQWTGIEGAPSGQFILADIPFSFKNIGIGFIVDRSSIGILKKNTLTAQYTYHLDLPTFSFSLGLQGSLRQYTQDFTDLYLLAIDGIDEDPILEGKVFRTNIANAGLGIFINSDKLSIGISIPRLIESNISFNTDIGISREQRHLYCQILYNRELSSIWRYKGGMLAKATTQSPIDFDIQNTVIYQDQLHLGLNCRTGGFDRSLIESVSMLIGFQFSPNIFTAISYDFTNTELRQHQDGSFELSLIYRKERKESPISIQNPRYF